MKKALYKKGSAQHKMFHNFLMHFCGVIAFQKKKWLFNQKSGFSKKKSLGKKCFLGKQLFAFQKKKFFSKKQFFSLIRKKSVFSKNHNFLGRQKPQNKIYSTRALFISSNGHLKGVSLPKKRVILVDAKNKTDESFDILNHILNQDGSQTRPESYPNNTGSIPV